MRIFIFKVFDLSNPTNPSPARNNKRRTQYRETHPSIVCHGVREENSEIEMQEKRAKQRETISGEVRG